MRRKKIINEEIFVLIKHQIFTETYITMSACMEDVSRIDFLRSCGEYQLYQSICFNMQFDT